MFPVILELVMRESLVCFSHLMGVFALFNGSTAVGKGIQQLIGMFVSERFLAAAIIQRIAKA